MLGFFASIFSVVWIQKHLALVLCVLAALLILIVFIIHRRRARRSAYLALPVQFIGNKSTKIYHTLDCPQLAKVAIINRIAFRLPEETKRLGYKPCGYCAPRWPLD